MKKVSEQQLDEMFGIELQKDTTQKEISIESIEDMQQEKHEKPIGSKSLLIPPSNNKNGGGVANALRKLMPIGSAQGRKTVAVNPSEF